MRLKILTPEKIILDTEIKGIFVRAVDGELGVLPGHIPMITALAIAPAHFITEDGEVEYITLISGTFKVENDEVTILTPRAELGEDIDAARAQVARDRAKAQMEGFLEQHVEKSSAEFETARVAMLRALARLSAADKSKKRF